MLLQAKDLGSKRQMIGRKQNSHHLLKIPILTLLLIGIGCRSGPEPVVEAVPEWVKSIPADETYYYAIGVSGPTPRIVDAWDQAIRRARAELGRVIISHITSRDTIISTSSGEYVSEIVKILSDAELNYTEVVERWADRSGVHGPAQHFYVLVRIEKRNAQSVLTNIK
jgi:hypothetical protein